MPGSVLAAKDGDSGLDDGDVSPQEDYSPPAPLVCQVTPVCRFQSTEIADLHIDFEHHETGELVPIVIPDVYVIGDPRVFILGILDMKDDTKPQRGMDMDTGRIFLRGVAQPLRAVQLIDADTGTSTLRMVARVPRHLPTSFTPMAAPSLPAMDARIVSISDAADEILAEIRKEQERSQREDQDQWIVTDSADGHTDVHPLDDIDSTHTTDTAAWTDEQQAAIIDHLRLMHLSHKRMQQIPHEEIAAHSALPDCAVCRVTHATKHPVKRSARPQDSMSRGGTPDSQRLTVCA